MNKRIITVIIIIALALAIVVTIKYNRLNIFTSTPDDILIESSAGSSEVKTAAEEEESEITLLNVGDEGIYEVISKNAKGEASSQSVRYKFKYIDFSITQEIPSGMEMTFYEYDEKDHLDSDDNFIDGAYYYVTVKYEMTNIREDDWADVSFSPHNLYIGRYVDGKYATFLGCEQRDFISDTPNIGGSICLEKDETALITCCYVVSKDILNEGNIIVKVDTGSKNAENIPCFVIDTEGTEY